MKKSYIKGFALLGIGFSIMLSSCQLVNKYNTPETDTANLFRDENPTDTTTIASIPWRQYFTDPILQALVDEGLCNNLDMQIAEERIKQAEANLTVARAAYFPNVSLVGQVNQSRLSSADPLTKTARDRNSLAYHMETYSLGVSASWELDVWGKINREQRASYAQMLNSRAGRNLVQTSLVANIATSYYSLLALDEQLKITLNMIDILKESYTTMEAMMEAGLLNRAAIEQSKALLYSTQISIPTLKSNIKEVENSLSMLIGRKPGPIFRSTFSDQQFIPQLAHGIPAQMLANRPDVQQAELTFRSAFELKVAAQASFYPSITLSSGTIGYSTVNGLSQFFKPENLFANIIGGITQPLFAKAQLISQLKVRTSQEKEAYLGFRKAVLNASQEVSTILYSYQQSLSKNAVRSDQVNSLSTAVSDTQELLKAGEAMYTEVLTSEQNLLSAQLSQISDKLEQLQYSVNLYRALGGGLK